MVSRGGKEVAANPLDSPRRASRDLPSLVREFHVTRGASGVEIHFEAIWLLADIDRSN